MSTTPTFITAAEARERTARSAAEHEALRLAAGRFRKKPVVIDAWAIDFNNTPYPEWVEEAFAKDETVAGFIDWCPTGEGLYINTIEGHMQAKVGDFLIRGVAGELYACRADIFAATYEAEHVSLHALTQKGGWRPIETAPKDGRSVLLLGRNARHADGFWEKKAYAGNGCWVWPYVKAEPIAWQPLPPSPAAERAQERGR